MSWATPKTKGYTVKGGNESEIKLKIKDAISRGHKLQSQGSTRISPERIMYWAKMTM